MKELQEKLQKMITYLKFRPWTHVFVWTTYLGLIIYILFVTYYLIEIFLFANTSNDINLTYCAFWLLTWLFFNFYFIIILSITFICFLIELFTEFKISNNYLINNLLYNRFWILGFVLFVIFCILPVKMFVSYVLTGIMH